MIGRPRNCEWWLSLLLCCIIELKRIDGFVNNPKIITKDGNLIIESGLNRNISFSLGGTSRLIINDKWDLLALLLRQSIPSVSSDEYDNNQQIASLRELNTLFANIKLSIHGPQGIEQGLRLVQNSTVTGNQLIRRYRTRVINLDAKVKRLTDRLELDNCKDNPCENGGTCFNLFNGFQCKCAKSFEGSKCERDVNECALYAGTDLGCQNDGECVNQFGGYSCICSSGWYGIHCTQRKDCSQSSAWELCGHGTCVSSSNTHGYSCICDQGWKTNGLTPACMVDVDECNGSETDQRPACATKCINLPGSFVCAPCPPGLTGNGLTCRDIDECAANNGGCSINPHVNCINTHGSYQCHECPIGWRGDGKVCTRDSTSNDDDNEGSGGTAFGVRTCTGHNICHSSAKCMEISNTIVCSCPVDMIGDGVGPYGCQPRKQITCNDLPCLNGGTCRDKSDNTGYECSCLAGYNQPNCASALDPCGNRPCGSNGMCRPVNETMFQCHCMPGFSGQQCQTQVPSKCGGVLSGPNGQLKYPAKSSDGTYEHNSQCAWVITTIDSKVLNVTFDTFDLEDTSECRADWLQINDGRTAAAQVLGRFCGSYKPMGGNIISSTNNLYLWFRSDNLLTKEGFTLHWDSIEPQCGGTIQFETHGTIASPGSPGNYPKNRDCHWHLQAPNSKRIKLTFFSLRIENHESCNYDYIEITDVVSNEVLAKYCKSMHPEPLLLPTSEVDIHFHSDSEGSDTGFQIYYSTETRIPGCGGTYTASEGNIKSPDSTLDMSISCEYDIKVAEGASIRIEFVVLELKLPSDCLEFYDINESREINYLQVKFCGDYGINLKVFNSMYNKVRVKYYGIGNKFELNYRTDCSYTYENDQGIITSPNYPQSLPSMERSCTYTIRTKPGTVITLHVIDFEIKNNSSLGDDSCTFNALEISDEFGHSAWGSFCSDKMPISPDLLSDTNSLKLYFRTKAVEGVGRGFKIDYKAVPMDENGCGGVYTKPAGHIKLPTNDEGNYLHDLECYWIIKAPSDKRITLNWKSFKLEETESCYYDYVEIYDSLENSNTGKPLVRYCGETVPPALMSYSSILVLKFESDSSDNSEGFEVNYEFIDYKSNCGGNILASTGALTSPDYPLNYTNGMDCTWTINSPKGTQIELLVDMFELEPTFKCTGDWLEVRNGGSEQSHLLGSFCGTEIPRTMPSFTNQLRIHFHSDNFVNARGFKIHWNIFSNNCGGTLAGNNGVITSPNYPNSYPENVQCEWLILGKKGSVLQITIENMAIESLFDCAYDYLQIFEGRNSDKLLSTFCDLPNGEPHTITINNSAALVRFESDGSNSDNGFLLSYKTICTHTLTEVYGVIESLNYNDPYYSDNINCTWTIKAPKGNHVILELTYFNSNSSDDAIYFLEKSKTHIIHSTQIFNSTEDVISIVQNSSSLSFQIEYQMYGCMQQFKRDSGEFQSPNYPNLYPNDVECLWIISTSLGRGIELTIENMDIEETVNCTSDALIISSNQTSHNVKERHCGRHNTEIVITSSSHQMYVRFLSNSHRNSKGFTAKYRTLESSCGGILKSRNGVVQSPNYPMRYAPNLECEWTIIVSQGHTITLTLEELELEYFYDCEMDYVQATEMQEVSNNTDTNNDNDDESNERVLFTKCGSLSNEDINQWTTKTNTAVIRFHTDETQEHKGFKLTYHENCGQRLSVSDTKYGEIELVRTTGVNQTCVWEINSSDRSKKIMLKITHVSLTPTASIMLSEADCIENGVKVIDGTNVKGPVISKFCRNHPPDIISKGHVLTVMVPLPVISEFSATYYTIDSWCGGYYTGMQGTFSSPFYPASYPVDIDCDWYLEASEGNSYTITFETMSIEESEDCNRDYLEIREKDNRGRLLGLFCGSTTPSLEPITSQKIWVKFSSDDNSVVGQGFLASYNYVTHNELNGTSGIIESPHYPTIFRTHEKYSWRISVSRDFVIILTITHVVDVDKPHIKFYDGYLDIGAPIDYSDSLIIRSHTSSLYITATRGPFRFEWKALSKEALASNETAERMAQQCRGGVVNVQTSVSLISPGYPNGYENDLNCSWTIVPESPAMHVTFSFITVDLEDFSDCAADFVVVSSSSDLQHWKKLDKICKKTNTTVQKYHGNPYLKLEFITDASLNKTGFRGIARTDCGSTISDRKGLINVTESVYQTFGSQINCVWTLHVREGRRLRITFPEAILQNSNGNCRNYFVVRNGISEDSPFLGHGKFCNDNITDVLDTSSNWAYIKFVRSFTSFRASFHFEEIAHSCSDDIQLSMDSNSDSIKTIFSPNYPNLPNPHSECIWRITAPLHKVIAIHFIGLFQLADEPNCNHEYVQINDGATELMPSLGRYCGNIRPDTQYSSSNVLRVKYFNDLSEPHIGFSANVSIGQCGGLYFQSEGVIYSPTQLNFQREETNFECVYTIEMQRGHTINITLDKMDLPYSENCSTVSHLRLEEINRNDDGEYVSDTLSLCGGDEHRRYIVETNKLVIRYKIIGEKQFSHSFKVSYNTIGDRCGQKLIASRGTLQSPNYPEGVIRPTHCFWHLTVPKGRRVKVEFIDFDTGATENNRSYPVLVYGRILLANDFEMQSIITRITRMPSTPLYSTDNTMAIDIFLLPFSRIRGFRMRFSSDEENFRCKDIMISSNLIRYEPGSDNSSLYCRYNANVPRASTLAVHVSKFKHELNNQPWFGLGEQLCRTLAPLKLQLQTDEWLTQLLCNTGTLPTLRLPFPVMIVLNANSRNKLQEIEFNYQVHKCGGLMSLELENSLNISQPLIPSLNENTNNTVECAWLVGYALDTLAPSYDDFIMDNVQLEISLKTDFLGKCEDQYLQIYNGPNHNAPTLGRYCERATAINLVVERGLFFEYSASNYELKSTFTVTIRYGSGCGGTLKYPYRDILFDEQYGNNVECIWEIVADPGFYISVMFLDRFFIESSPNCTKDYILIQEQTESGSEITWRDLRRICGREAPAAVNTTTTRMRFIFRSDNDTRGDGFIAQFKQFCGGTYYANALEKYLISPGYPIAYPPNLSCEYIILPPIDSVDNVGIIVRFLDFTLEPPHPYQCTFDNVTVKAWDTESDLASSTILCGSIRTKEFRAKNRISVVMHTDKTIAAKGFKIAYSTNVCGGNVTNTTLVKSPQDHLSGHYPRSSKCYWNITAPQGYKIYVKFEQIDFESLSSCSFDGVEVYNGLLRDESKNMGRFCGNFTGRQLPEISIPSNTGLLHSYSDDRDPSLGFKALVMFKINCDKQIFLGANNDSYEFDEYAHGYTNNLDCEFIIKTEPGRQLMLHFNSFHVEESDGCLNDFLELRDGAGSFADQIARLCGHKLPTTEIMSSRNILYLHFASDEEETSGGFSIKITSVQKLCGRHNLQLKAGESIELKAPMNSNGKYLKNINCMWTIKSENSIQLHFDKLDIEGPDANGTCTNDYLKIYTGEDMSDTDINRSNVMVFNGLVDTYNNPFSNKVMYVYCGNIRPSNEYFNSGIIDIKFTSNAENEGSGFSLTAHAATGCFRNYTELQGRIVLNSKAVQHCDIYITVPSNYTLTLYYANLHFYTFECADGFLEVFDANTNKTLQKNCGYIDAGKNLFSNSSSLRLNVKTGEYSAVDITYLASSAGPGCGGEIYNSAGIITNPFYPNHVREYSNCRWNIQVPKNLHVLVEFDEFDMGAKTTCQSDYLQIIEYSATGSERVVRQFCGGDNPKAYMSTSNYITIYFHKTLNFDGTGWKMSYKGTHPETSAVENSLMY